MMIIRTELKLDIHITCNFKLSLKMNSTFVDRTHYMAYFN